jgi:hypothetical protein
MTVTRDGLLDRLAKPRLRKMNVWHAIKDPVVRLRLAAVYQVVSAHELSGSGRHRHCLTTRQLEAVSIWKCA